MMFLTRRQDRRRQPDRDFGTPSEFLGAVPRLHSALPNYVRNQIRFCGQDLHRLQTDFARGESRRSRVFLPC
jgi:hypothetical protein